VLSNESDVAQTAFFREAAILRYVNRDRNIVQLYGVSLFPNGTLLLVTERMEGGDLRAAIDRERWLVLPAGQNRSNDPLPLHLVAVD
jgi:serine/threonine protein kinase